MGEEMVMQSTNLNIEGLTIENSPLPQYVRIRKDPNPIFIWGAGALAVSVYHYCRNFDIHPAGCFVNLNPSAEQFHGLEVFTLDAVRERYPHFSVIIGHADYAGGTAYLQGIKEVQHIYCLSSCCYNTRNLISMDLLKKESEAWNSLYDSLQDHRSKRCLRTYLESRMNDRAEYMFSCFQPGENYYTNDVLHLTAQEILLDVGACVGSAIWPFIDAVDGKYRKIIALEPDRENYDLLVKNVEARCIQGTVLKRVCAYNKNGQVKFAGSKECGGIMETSGDFQMYPSITIDSLCSDLGPDNFPSIIKINFPFSVPEILQGAESLLKTRKPKLIIRAGFDENVLLETYRTIKEINPMYRLYLRYTLGIPQGLTIFAV